MIPLRTAPAPGYAPTIGRLVSILTYIRQGSLTAVDGLSCDQLDHLHDAESNTIGAPLAHMAAVERWYRMFTFDARGAISSEMAAVSVPQHLGDEDRPAIKGRDLSSYLEEL